MPEVYHPAGVDLTRTHSTPQFKLGSIARAEQGQRYQYVLSSGAITQYALVCIDENFTARQANTTLAKEASGPGWPQIAMATDQYGWVAIDGTGILGRMKDATAANAQLFTSASVGIMASVASAGAPVMIAGCRNVALSSGAGTAYEINCVSPHFIVVETME
jgi:hypothetical protein